MSRMGRLAIEVANGDVPTIQQALADLVAACYVETSIQGRWKESGPKRCSICGATQGDPMMGHRPDCEVWMAEKALLAAGTERERP